MPLLCVALGGGTARWSQGVALLLLGLLLLVRPPQASLGWKFNLILAGLAALTLTAFLPAGWFSRPSWRAALVDDFGAILPATLSPQPWLTAESALLFLAGLCWFYLLATVNWTLEERLRAGRIFGGGVVALAGLFLLVLKLRLNVPFWLTERHFGPFPNRNQTANFLAVGALPVLACAQLAWRAGRRGSAVAWTAGWLVVALAAFTSFSRAGVFLLFLGTGVYLLIQANRLRQREAAAVANIRRQLDRWRGVALAISLVAILLSALLIFGGETLDRITPASATSTVTAVTTEFRLRIQGDALRMIAASPWCGLGLGNFASVFPIFRVNSALPARAIHPESDWLWLAAELGWPALALVLAGCALLPLGIWPWRREADRPLRTAAAVALVAFAVHSFVDVSAHRLGTCLCALFVLGLALRGERTGTPAFRLPARWPAPLFRVLGLVLVLAGGTWILQARGFALLPGEQRIESLETMGVYAAARRDYSAVESDMSAELALAPLRWNAYFTRGGARVYLGRDPDSAAADFRCARYLEPFIGNLPLDEALIWLAAGHSALAVNALVEACRREPLRAGEYTDRVYSVAPQDTVFQAQLSNIARQSPLLLLPYLNNLEPPQSGAFIAACVRADPNLAKLNPAQRTRFFLFWAQRGDAAALAALMPRHPQWQKLGWRWWADACAHGGAYEQACGIAARFATPPVVPNLAGAEKLSRAELEEQSDAQPGDVVLLLRLYNAIHQDGDASAALAVLRRAVALPDAPAYLHYLEARTAAEAGDWQVSWNAWQDYLHAWAVQE